MGNSGSSPLSTLVVDGHVLRIRVSRVDGCVQAPQAGETNTYPDTPNPPTTRTQQPLGEPSVSRGSSGGGSTTTTVYLAEDDARRKFALQVTRVPKEDARGNAQAARELKEHARLPPHPHLLAYVASKIDGTSDGAHTLYYLVTEHCPRTVKALMDGAGKRREPLHEREVLNVFTSAAVAVA